MSSAQVSRYMSHVKNDGVRACRWICLLFDVTAWWTNSQEAMLFQCIVHRREFPPRHSIDAFFHELMKILARIGKLHANQSKLTIYYYRIVRRTRVVQRDFRVLSVTSVRVSATCCQVCGEWHWFEGRLRFGTTLQCWVCSLSFNRRDEFNWIVAFRSEEIINMQDSLMWEIR